MTPIFVYGTLRSSAVRHALLNKSTRAQDGVFVRGFKSLSVAGCVYPGIISTQSTSENDDIVHGSLIYDLNEEDMAILALFEDEYRLEDVMVYSDVGSDPVRAKLYLWNLSIDRLDMNQPWNYETSFLAVAGLEKQFAANAAAFRQQALLQLQNTH